MSKHSKKNVKSSCGWLLVLTLLLASVPWGQVQAAPTGEPPTEGEERMLPTGGISPFTELPELVEGNEDVVVTAKVKPFQTYAYVAPQVPGGTRYGYDWISNSANTGADSTMLAAIYEALVAYADMAYQTTATYTYAGTYYHAGAISFDVNTVNLPIDEVNGSVDQNGANTIRSLNLLRLAWSVFGRDNPQYYMFGNGFSYSRITGAQSRIVQMRPYSSVEYATYSARQDANDVIAAKYAEYEWLAGTVDTTADKMRIVHDKMVAERDYSYVGGSPDSSATAHNILGVMDVSAHGPVCEAYAEAYTYILNRLGINALTIFGLGNGGGHAWNLVQNEGEYYYVDATWDDFETVGRSTGSYDDVGNQKNIVYYLYFMVGNGNTNFTSKHAAGTPTGGNGYYSFGLPSNISPTDFNTMTGSEYQWLTDNGRNNKSYAYGPNYDYYIGYTDILGYPTPDPDGLYENRNGSWYFNGWKSHYFGSYSISSSAACVPVTAQLWRWNFDYTSPYFNVQFNNPVPLTQGEDYKIVVEKPYKQGLNRAYVFGKGDYRGVDLGVVDINFTD